MMLSSPSSSNEVSSHNQLLNGTDTLYSLNSNYSLANMQQTNSSNMSNGNSYLGLSEADRKRAHHNALERKRRDHIKDSFHTLRDAIPNIKGEKVSMNSMSSSCSSQISKHNTNNKKENVTMKLNYIINSYFLYVFLNM
jgi:hypothetical protein